MRIGDEVELIVSLSKGMQNYKSIGLIKKGSRGRIIEMRDNYAKILSKSGKVFSEIDVIYLRQVK